MIHARKDYNRIQDPAVDAPELLSVGIGKRKTVANLRMFLILNLRSSTMYRVVIYIDRQQTEQFKTTGSNQEALERINAAVAARPGAGWGQMNVAGASYGQSLFPPWMSDALAANIPGLSYDNLNFQFYADFEEQADAQKASQWVQQFKGWAIQNGVTLQDKDIAKGLDSRIMDAGDESLKGLEF